MERTSIPRRLRGVTDVRFGNVGRNTMRGPGVANLDVGLFRYVQGEQRIDLQFRPEAFNATNTPHFSNPNGNVNSSNFGRVLATQTADAMGGRGSSASACA